MKADLVDGKLDQLTTLEEKLNKYRVNLSVLKGELQEFEQEYNSLVGKRYEELETLQKKIAQCKKKGENQGSVDFENSTVVDKSNAKFPEEQGFIWKEQKDFNIQTTLKSTKSMSLKKFYREVAKCLHPDLAVNQVERLQRQYFMSEVNQAYAEGDEAKIRAISTIWKQIHLSAEEGYNFLELLLIEQRIFEAKKLIEKFQREIDNLRKSEIYQLKMQVSKARNQGQDLLLEMAHQLDQEIKTAHQKLKEFKIEV